MEYRLLATTLAASLLSLGLVSMNSYAASPQNMTIADNGATMQSSNNSNLAAGQAFLAANANKPGVITLPDGLQYKVLTEGTGARPTGSDVVTVNYSGSLINGTEFDSSYKRGQPTSFPVNAVIPGWTEALQLMKTGSTWMLYIPASLAYGEQGAPPAIGPNETLIFKVDLLSITR